MFISNVPGTELVDDDFCGLLVPTDHTALNGIILFNIIILPVPVDFITLYQVSTVSAVKVMLYSDYGLWLSKERILKW